MSENRIVSELSYDSDQGALRYRGVRYLLIRPETLVSLQSAMEAEIGPEATGSVLYQGGYTGGRLSGQKFKQELELSDREAVEFMCRMGGEIGWGKFQLIDFAEDGRRLVVEVHGSAFAEAFNRKASGAVCHLICGVLGGLLSGLADAEVRSQETTCLAKGDPRCRFEVEVQP